MKVSSNIKNMGGSAHDIGNRLVIAGGNESGKSALAMSILLPLTKVGQYEVFRLKASGRTLSALCPAGTDTVIATITEDDGTMIAEWRLKGQGNPAMSGKRAGKLVNVWSTLTDLLAGNAPKLAEGVLASPAVTSAEAQWTLKHYRAAKKAHAALKRNAPGDVPSLPPDPSAELVQRFHEIEEAAKRGAVQADHRIKILDVAVRAHRFKQGKLGALAIAEYRGKLLEAETALEQATKTLLDAAVDPMAAICVDAAQYLDDGEALNFDLRKNSVWLTRDDTAHYALSGTGGVRVLMALGAAIYGAKGVFVVPDVGWEPATLRRFLDQAGRTPLGQVVLTLPSVSEKAQLPHPWTLVRLEG